MRSKSTRKSSSTEVKPEDVVEFYKDLREIMQQCMSFKGKYFFINTPTISFQITLNYQDMEIKELPNKC